MSMQSSIYFEATESDLAHLDVSQVGCELVVHNGQLVAIRLGEVEVNLEVTEVHEQVTQQLCRVMGHG